MSDTIVAKRYANALFQLAQEQSKLEQFELELKTVGAVLQNNASFYTFLKHPRITSDQKKQVISDSFKSISDELINTMKLLVDRHREETIPEFIHQFITMVNDKKGIADATVYSTRELSENEQQQISKTFAKKVSKKSLIITNIVDPSLLGGIRVRVGNRIFDGSVSGKLNRLERELVSNKR